MFNIWHVMNKCTVVAKRELFYVWPFGLAAWLAGLIFIDRVRGEKARDTLNQVNSKIKKQKIKLWVFPEGTRRNTGEIHEFKKGAFHMAIDEQIPILPVVFSSYCTFFNSKKKILNSGTIILTTLPPIPTKGLTKDDLPELMEKVHSQMQDTFKQSSNEILQRYASNMKNKKSTIDTTVTAIKQSTSSSSPSSAASLLTKPSSKSLSCDFTRKTSSKTKSQAQDILNTATAKEFKDTILTKTHQALVH